MSYILSANKLYYNVLNNINFDIPKKFEGKNLNIKYLNNLIKRYTRRYPAYTSQICSKCGRFGVRDGDSFVCDNCGEIHADINASINILERKYDKEIKMFTSYKKVKEILESRIADTK